MTLASPLRGRFAATVALVLVASAGPALAGVYSSEPLLRTADATVDLTDPRALDLVNGQWRFHDVGIDAVDHQKPGPDLKASGAPTRTHDIKPAAGAAFDDAAWEVIAPESLSVRRGDGKLSFAWYRLRATIPAKLGAFSTAGSTVVFEIVVDDYAEVWVDGQLPVMLGQRGGSLAAGFNAPNRVVVTREARPGQTFTIAVFGVNAPLSAPPANFIWVRSATLDFYSEKRARVGEPVATEVDRRDPALDRIVAPGTMIERLATGFEFIEGPVWVSDGYLLFSDPNANRIYRWTTDGEVSIFRTKSGYAGLDIGEYGQPGSNGLALDAEGRLTICEHGNRRVTRIEKNGVVTVLADRYQGKRLNSPNDLVYRRDGTVCFSDPPFGLPKFHDDRRRELAITGIFCLTGDRLELVSSELSGPNGLAFSPDERYLYVANWDPARKIVVRYRRLGDGRYGDGEVLFDMAGAPGEEALDGLKVDNEGNLYVSGPGGVWILSAEGKHLGTVSGPELAANFAFGDDDGRTLYLTARTGLYRMRLGVSGRRPQP